MIYLPVKPLPNAMEPSLLDLGFIQRGAASLRVDRPGGRYRITFGFPPMQPEQSTGFTSRLKRAKRQGLQVVIPLLRSQGIPGAPVVDGAGQSGSSIDVKGFNLGYIIREDYWLTIIEADGTAYLHSVVETVVATDGTATIEIEPPLRAPFPDEAEIEFAAPYMQGFMDGDAFTYRVPGSPHSIEIGITVEEYR